MISAWWLIPAVMVGAVLGIFAISLVSLSDFDETDE